MLENVSIIIPCSYQGWRTLHCPICMWHTFQNRIEGNYVYISCLEIQYYGCHVLYNRQGQNLLWVCMDKYGKIQVSKITHLLLLQCLKLPAIHCVQHTLLLLWNSITTETL